MSASTRAHDPTAEEQDAGAQLRRTLAAGDPQRVREQHEAADRHPAVGRFVNHLTDRRVLPYCVSVFRTRQVCLLAILLSACALSSACATHDPGRPRLAVVVVIDQFRAGDLQRLRPLYGDGGFAGVAEGKESASLVGRYQHACTETAPGHATLSTGAAPSVHGIIVNNWFTGRALTYAVSDPEHGRSAARMLAPTLGDALKLATQGVGKVAAVSIKDRGAILSAGSAADAAVWLNPRTARFTTSRAYPATPAELLVPATLTDWDGHMTATAPAGISDPDQGGFIHPPSGWGPGFPHRFQDLGEGVAGWAYRMTPTAAEQLLDLGVQTLEVLKLGADDTPDLLIVSVSTTDYVGHAFGPHSPQYADVMAHLDVALRKFRARVEAAVGPGRTIWAISGDHGAGPATERLLRWGKPGGAITMQAIASAAERAMLETAGANPAGPWVVGVEPPHLYLDLDPLPADRRPAALKAARKAVAGVAGVAITFLPDDPPTPNDPLEAAARLCHLPGRSGQIMLVQKEGWTFDDEESPSAANHGSPYPYDQEVPLILWGPGERAGLHQERVDPRDLAPTLAKLLRIPPPAQAQGRVLTEALR